VIAALGFGYSSTLALLPFSIFCGALGICTFLFRRRKPFSFLTFPLWILLFATANFFSGIQSGHAFPQLAYQRLLSDGKPLREAEKSGSANGRSCAFAGFFSRARRCQSVGEGCGVAEDLGGDP
jgi:hypothetical protein